MSVTDDEPPVGDMDAVEVREMAEDLVAYRQAKMNDDGTRVSLEQLRAELSGLRP